MKMMKTDLTSGGFTVIIPIFILILDKLKLCLVGPIPNVNFMEVLISRYFER